MQNRFVLKFTKVGYVKYISHLDLLNVFKRAFKMAKVDLKYSQGFNPHPRMSFAQPLSLGYSSTAELFEFETQVEYSTETLMQMLADKFPVGIEILSIEEVPATVKSVSGDIVSATYVITYPISFAQADLDAKLEDYLARNEIFALKKVKKTKSLEPVNIRHMILELSGESLENTSTLKCRVSCGSLANLSPELLIKSFNELENIDIDRSEIEVERTGLYFQ